MENVKTKVCRECGRVLPVTKFNNFERKSKDGVKHIAFAVCKQCCSRKRVESNKKKIEGARMLRLDDFTPRELIAQLKKLGYEGRLTYTKVETVDLNKF